MKRVFASSVALLLAIGASSLFLSASSVVVPSGTWELTGDLAETRAGAAAVLLADGVVLMTGGSGPDGRSASAERYSVAGGTFIPTASMHTARANHTAISLNDGRVLVIGGFGADGVVIGSAEIYDPATNAWAPAGTLVHARAAHTATLLPDGRVLVAGGENVDGALATLEVYSPVFEEFVLVATPMTTARMRHAAALVGEQVLIMGGWDGAAALASVDVYDPATDSVAAGTAMLGARAEHTATTLLSGNVLVAGGMNAQGELQTAEVFDAVAGGFVATANAMSSARRNHIAILLPHNNSVLIAGGWSDGAASATTELYRAWQDGGIFVSTGSSRAARNWSAGSALSFAASATNRSGPADGLVLVAGGEGTSSAELYGFATVKTDKDDYSPGMTVRVSGSGWQPNQSVTFYLRELTAEHYARLFTIDADGSGNIDWTDLFLVEEHHLGVHFLLTAGDGVSQAHMAFTDNHTMSVSCAPVSVAVATGTICTGTIGAGTTGQPASGRTVTFSSNGAGSFSPLATCVTAGSNATASCSVTYLPSTVGTGTHRITGSFSFSAGHTNSKFFDVTVTPGTLTNQTISVITPAPALASYGSSFSVAATGGGSGNPVLITTTGVCSGSGSDSATITMTSGVGSCEVHYNQAGSASFNAAPEVTNNTNAIKAFATVTVTGYTGTYDAAAHGAGGSATGVDAGGAAVGTTLDLGATFTNYPGGTATWTFTGGTNYTDQTGTAAIIINKALATVTVTGYSGPYDAATHGATGSATGVDAGGAALGTTLDLGATFINYPGGTATWTFTGGTNYTDQTGTAAIIINKAVATVTVTGYTGTYDATTHGATGSATGVDAGGAALGTTLALGATFINYPGGTATWTFTGGTNYTDQNGTAAIVINKAIANVTVTGYTGTYDGAAHGATGSATGVDAGSAALGTILNLGASFVNFPGGAANWTFTGGANYTDQAGSVETVINKAVANVNVTGYTGNYDAAAHGATGSVTGVDAGAALGTTLDLGATFVNVPGGTANWTFTGGTNYTDQTGTAAIVINKANVSINVADYTGVYDGLAHGATGTATGVSSEVLAGLNLGANFTNVPGGTANWTFTDVTGNYNDASGTAAIVINKANAAIVVNGYTGNYDGAAHGATGSATGVSSEELSGMDLGASFTNVPGGTASWTFTDVTGNYNDASGTAAIVINKANASINVAEYSGVYDGAAHGAAGTATGVLSEALTGLDLGATFTNAPGGTANWTFTDVTGNYNDASGTAAIVINKANASINVTDYTGVYDGVAHGATGTATGVLSETLAGLDLGSAFMNVPGGTANWTFTDVTGNYNDASGTAAIVINKANASINVAEYTGVYDGAAHGATGTATGASSEALAGLNLGASFTNVPGGTANWTFTDVTGNYNNTSGTTAVVISKANATINVTGYTGVYDGLAHGATGTATGVLSEALAGLNLGLTFTSVPGGTANWTFVDVTGNYNDANSTVAIVINKAVANVVVTGYTGIYDSAAHGATGSVTGVDAGGAALGTTLNLGASFTDYPGGTANWTFSGGTNYTDQNGTKAIVINKATPIVTVSFGASPITYDGNPHPAAVTVTGVSGPLTLPGNGNTTIAYTRNAAPFAESPTLIGNYTASASFTSTNVNYTNTSSTTDALLTILTACSTFNGFFAPIGGAVENNNTGGSFLDPVRAFKLNSTIPVKFNATCFGAPLTTGTHTLQATKASNATSYEAAIDATPTDAATTGNQFRLTGTEWHFNLSTKVGMSQGIWLLKGTLFDGSTYTVWVEIKK